MVAVLASVFLTKEKWHGRLESILGVEKQPMSAADTLRAVIDVAKSIRAMTMEEAACIAENGCLVPPDGGSPTEVEVELCKEIASRIRSKI